MALFEKMVKHSILHTYPGVIMQCLTILLLEFFALILKRKQGLKKIENVWADMLVASSVMLCSFVYVVSSAVYVNMIKELMHLAEHQGISKGYLR